MKKRDIIKNKKSTHRSRSHTNTLVPNELNDQWELLKEKFITWYYYMLNLRDNFETATGRFRD